MGRSPIGRSLRIIVQYKASIALSLAIIPLSGSFSLERIESKKTLRLVNIIVSRVYIISGTAYRTILGCSRSFLNMLASSI